jgi:hypothetical protein
MGAFNGNFGRTCLDASVATDTDQDIGGSQLAHDQAEAREHLQLLHEGKG